VFTEHPSCIVHSVSEHPKREQVTAAADMLANDEFWGNVVEGWLAESGASCLPTSNLHKLVWRDMAASCVQTHLPQTAANYETMDNTGMFPLPSVCN